MLFFGRRNQAATPEPDPHADLIESILSDDQLRNKVSAAISEFEALLNPAAGPKRGRKLLGLSLLTAVPAVIASVPQARQALLDAYFGPEQTLDYSGGNQ